MNGKAQRIWQSCGALEKAPRQLPLWAIGRIKPNGSFCTNPPSFRLAGSGARPRSCQSCAPGPGNTAEVGGEGARPGTTCGPGRTGRETGLWPKAGGGQKLTQDLSERPVALSLKHTHFLALDAELSLGQGGYAIISGLGVGPAALGAQLCCLSPGPSPSDACLSHPCWLRISSTCKSKAAILQLLYSL